MAVMSREELKQYALRALGHPLVEVDITPEAMDDRIEEALDFFHEYYFDGSDKVFYKHQITQQDIINQYITVPSNIWGITNIFPFSNNINEPFNIFGLQKSISNIASTSMIYYEQAMQHLSLIDSTLNTTRQFRFNRNTDKVFIDTNWKARFSPGTWLLLECYSIIDPEQNQKLWNNRTLKEYVIALFKKQWAQAYYKFDNIQLPGGVTVDGKTMYNDAKAECDDIEQNIMNNQAPFTMLVG
jgi:hypothetical protein